MRIQVLCLPDKLVDGEYRNRFALILDEYASENLVDHEAAQTFRAFAKECGAEDGLVVDRRVDVVEQEASAELVSEIVTQLDDLISRRLDEHQAARTSYHFAPPTVTNAAFIRQFADAEASRSQHG